MASFFQFPWQDLQNLKSVQGHAISDDGNTAVFYLNWNGGPGGNDRFTFVSYDFLDGTWNDIWPFPGLNDQPYLIPDDAGTTVAFANREQLAFNDLNNGTDVYVLDLATGVPTLIFNADNPSGGTTVADYSGDASTVAMGLGSVRGREIREPTIVDLATSETLDITPILQLAGYETSDRTRFYEIELSDDGSIFAAHFFQGGLIVYDQTDGSLFDIRNVEGFEELGTGGPVNIELSGDGRYVFFDYNGSASLSDSSVYGLVRINIATQELEYVYQGDNQFGHGQYSVSDDGRFVTFITRQPDLVPSDGIADGSSPDNDLFLRDMLLGETYLLSDEGPLAFPFNGAVPQISGDGTRILIDGNAFPDELGLPDEAWSDATAIDGKGIWIPTIDGDAQDNQLTGTQDNDCIRGLAGNDRLEGGRGNDMLEGGDGFDTAQFSGSQASYTLILSRGASIITDRRTDANGTDTLVGVEALNFETEAFDFLDPAVGLELTRFAGPVDLSVEQFESFIELYIAYFNRAPDAIGLNFWGTAFANGTSLEAIATLFVDQDETRATYPDGTTNTEFATSVYNNVLGRTPDQSGIDFWVGALDSNAVSRDQFILEVLRGAKAALKPEEGQAFVDQQLADRAYLENKVDIGAHFAVHRGMSDVDNAATAMALFDGTQNGIDQAVAAIDGFYQQALAPNNGEFLMQVVGVLDNPFETA